MGMTTSCSSNENIARGSCSRTLVSRTKILRSLAVATRAAVGFDTAFAPAFAPALWALFSPAFAFAVVFAVLFGALDLEEVLVDFVVERDWERDGERVCVIWERVIPRRPRRRQTTTGGEPVPYISTP
jgi:hypothetical protein